MIKADTGHLQLSVSSTHLNFNNLVPGAYKQQNINYTVDSSVNEDIWLVFDQTTEAYKRFSGAPDGGYDGGLGRYGHFAVAHNNTTRFTSYNLALPRATSGPDESCNVNANGNGGSNDQSTSVSDTPKYCGVPGAIRLASNVAHGGSGQIQFTFGVTGRWTAQNVTLMDVPFKIVGTQVGVRPDAPNF